MTEKTKNKAYEVPDTIYLPTLIQESLLPLRTGPKKVSRTYRDVDITIQAGTWKGEDLTLPSGAIARKLFQFIVQTAKHTKSPVVDLVSMNYLISTLGITKGSKNVRRLKEEIKALARMTIQVDKYKDDRELGVMERVISRFSINGTNQDGQISLFGSWVEIAPEFWERIQRQAGQPINRQAVWDLSKPLAIDVYLWIQRRAQARDLGQDGAVIRWKDIQEQFGRPGQRLRDLKRDFGAALDAAIEKIEDDEFSKGPMAKVVKEGVWIRRIPRQAHTEAQKNDLQGQMGWSLT
jgi:hypothetical protein